MKQVYVQVDMDETTPLSYDYDLVEDDKGLMLKYSNSGNWGEQLVGEVAATIEDSGDDLTIRISGNKPLKLDYLQAQQLLILLLGTTEEKLEFRESKLIKSI